MLWVLRACLICLLAYLQEQQRRDEQEGDSECGRPTVAPLTPLLNPNALHVFEQLASCRLSSLTLPFRCPAPRPWHCWKPGWRRARQLYNKSTNTNARFLEAWNWHYTLRGSRSNPMKHWASNGFYAQSDMVYEASSGCEDVVAQARERKNRKHKLLSNAFRRAFCSGFYSWLCYWVGLIEEITHIYWPVKRFRCNTHEWMCVCVCMWTLEKTDIHQWYNGPMKCKNVSQPQATNVKHSVDRSWH